MKRTLAVILAGASLVISACGSSVASPSVAGPGASTGTNPGSSPAGASASAARESMAPCRARKLGAAQTTRL